MASEVQTTTELFEDEVLNPLPPLILINLREKLEAEQVYINGITQNNHKKKSILLHRENEYQIWKSQPRPRYDLDIICCPSILDLEIDDAEVIRRLRVWNNCPRSIYLHCCGFWDEACRLGAYWRCYPRTRYLLAPGLPVDIYVKATPLDSSQISKATMRLQLAAAHKRDHVIGYFVVPIRVKFLKYLPPPRVEQYE